MARHTINVEIQGDADHLRRSVRNARKRLRAHRRAHRWDWLKAWMGRD